jgi:hypothetical protein
VDVETRVFAMADEPFALSTISPAAPPDTDYDAICAAVMATERGRWFLEEYARRNRSSDTAKVLGAIARMEAVIREGQSQQAGQSLRIELLEMARAIAQTRADVAEKRAPVAPEAAPDQRAAPPSVIAAAERLRDIAWAMRERDIEPKTCEQIESIAATVLSASALRNPHDSRVQRLNEMLHDLERRVDAMLERPVPPREPAMAAAADGPMAAAAENIASALHTRHTRSPPLPSGEVEQAADLPAELAEALSVEPSEVVAIPSERRQVEPEPDATPAERVELELEPLVVVPVSARTEETSTSSIELTPIELRFASPDPAPAGPEPAQRTPSTDAVSAGAERVAIDMAGDPPDAPLAEQTVATDVVATQVQADLEALGVISITAPTQTEREDGPDAPQESEVLSDAWQTSVAPPTPEPALAAGPTAEDVRVPSMWEPPAFPPPEPAADGAGADGPARHDDTRAPAAIPPQAPGKRSQDEIESELFETAVRPGPAPSGQVPRGALSAAAATADAARAGTPPPADHTELAPANTATVPQPLCVAVQPVPQHPGSDPLAALKAMTDEERIALFT